MKGDGLLSVTRLSDYGHIFFRAQNQGQTLASHGMVVRKK
jgi:hypothetical protein